MNEAIIRKQRVYMYLGRSTSHRCAVRICRYFWLTNLRPAVGAVHDITGEREVSASRTLGIVSMFIFPRRVTVHLTGDAIGYGVIARF